MRFIAQGGLVAACVCILFSGYGFAPQLHAQQAAVVDPALAAKGEWSASTTYAKDDIVTARGSSWISLHNNNINRVPGQTQPSTATFWQLFARGFNPTGAWSNSTKYQPDDLVTRGGQTFRAKLTNINKSTNNTTFWEVFAARGAAGPNTGVSDGTQSTPSISFSGDADTGIYSPGAGKVAMVEDGVLFLHNIGTQNIALGFGALANNTGSGNAAVGQSALAANTTGAGNTAMGAFALGNNTTGGNNTAMGVSALVSNTSGILNTAVGLSALSANSTGFDNTAVGAGALVSNTTAGNNTAMGQNALHANTTGNSNTAVGQGALSSNTTAFSNTAVGRSALLTATTATDNTAVGVSALASATTGGSNTAVGVGALASATTSSNNTAVGVTALNSATTGASNTAVGISALRDTTTGGSNTAVGENALNNNTVGGNNIAVGRDALLHNTSGSNNAAIGENAGSNPTAPASSIFIGNSGLAADTTTIKIGTQGTQTSAFMAGIAGVTVANSAAVLINTSTGQLGTVASSRRYKEDIAPMPDISAMLAKLRPVTFHYKPGHDDGSRELQYGLIAEDVAEVLPYLTVFNKDGAPETVKYHLLPTFLLAGYQAQQRTIAAQADEIAALKERVAATEALEARLAKLEAALPQVKAASLRD